MKPSEIPIIERADCPPDNWYFIAEAADCLYSEDGETWQKVLGEDYSGPVIVCAVGMKEEMKAKLTAQG